MITTSWTHCRFADDNAHGYKMPERASVDILQHEGYLGETLR